MGSDAPVTIDSSISDYLEATFHSKFARTRNLHNDYWYIWVKSGLLDYVCLQMRDKYQVPILDEKMDYQSGEIYVEDKSVTVDTHAFFDKWRYKKKFKDESGSLIGQLRLHSSTYWFLFDRIFYNTPLDIKEKWEGYDTESVFSITIPLEEKVFLAGFTKLEIAEIRKMIFSQLSEKLGRNLNDHESKIINNWCIRIKRKVRVPTSKKLVYLVVEQMKHHKTYEPGRDDDHNWSDNVRNTSERCAANISAKLPGDEYFDAVAYRKMAQRLYEQFPILHKFIS